MKNDLLTKKSSMAALYKSNTLNMLLGSQNYNDINKGEEKFTDNLFPPSDLSIYSGKTEFSAEFLNSDKVKGSVLNKGKFWSKPNQKSNYIWLRLSEVYKSGEINILKEPKEISYNPDILTEDVVQGGLGDCYFLSAISALAEKPERIKHLFPSLSFSPIGVFMVRVYIHGHPTEVLIDDYFPFLDTPKPQLAFTGINKRTKNIWPMILEKVWAKINLSYEDIIAGNSAEAFEFLSPAPIDTYYHDVHVDTLFDIIKHADTKDYIICTDITATEQTNLSHLTKMGLISNHAYTLIDHAEVEDRGVMTKILKLRNPWGTNEWVGDWSDKSYKWTEEIKTILNYDDEDDGTFWISYDDFCKFYTSTHICKVTAGHNFICSKFNYDKNLGFNLVRVNIPKDTSGFFIVNQKNSRIYRNAKGLSDFENKYCSVIVFKEMEDGDMVYIGGDCGKHNRLYVECEQIKKGKYYIAVSFPRKAEKAVSDYLSLKSSCSIEDDHTYRIGVYSPLTKLEIYDLQGKEEQEKTSEFLKDVIFDLAKTNSDNLHYFADEGEKDSWRSISFEKDAGSYGYIAYENNSDAIIKEKLTLTEFNNINLIPVGDITYPCGDEEKVVEDPQLREIISRLKSEFKFTTQVETASSPILIDEKNPVIVNISVAPKSRCLILLEKTEEDASIDLQSKVALVYPSYALLSDGKLSTKKTRIKYNQDFVEIYESIIEHSAGVLFLYKNKTENLKFTCQIVLSDLENLSKASHENNGNECSKSNEIAINLEPGQTTFFELRSNDPFESYSYSCEMNYQMNLSRNRLKLKTNK